MIWNKANKCLKRLPYSILTAKPKTFKPNLMDEPKDMSGPEFFFSVYQTETISKI